LNAICILNVYGDFLANAHRRASYERVVAHLRSQGIEPVTPPEHVASKVGTIRWAAAEPRFADSEYFVFHDADAIVPLADILASPGDADCIQPYAWLYNESGNWQVPMPYGPPCWIVRRAHLRRVLERDKTHEQFVTSWGDFYLACLCVLEGTYRLVEQHYTHLDHPRGDQRANAHELGKMRHELRSQGVHWPDHHGVERLREFLHIPKPPKPEMPEAEQDGGVVRQTARAARRTAHGATSAAKTAVGIDRLPPPEVQRRLNVCRSCHHAVWEKDGSDVYTCGPMVESLRRAGQGTCGCVLSIKARDAKEACPFGYWPTVEGEGVKG